MLRSAEQFQAAISSKTFRPAHTILQNMSQPPSEKRPKEETHDPVDWPEFRQFARNVLHDTISYTSGIRELSMWRGVSESGGPPK